MRQVPRHLAMHAAEHFGLPPANELYRRIRMWPSQEPEGLYCRWVRPHCKLVFVHLRKNSRKQKIADELRKLTELLSEFSTYLPVLSTSHKRLVP